MMAEPEFQSTHETVNLPVALCPHCSHPEDGHFPFYSPRLGNGRRCKVCVQRGGPCF